ncbi:MAG: hypothetical protein Q9215_007961 [Flavoplaca cf. flavocitrina]
MYPSGSWRNPPPGTPVKGEPDKDHQLGQKVTDLQDPIARSNFRVVVIKPDEVEATDISNPETARRRKYTFVADAQDGKETEDPNQTTIKEPQLATPAAKSPENNFPNGGLHAWLQVLGAFFLVFNSCHLHFERGIINSFGAYQTYYQTALTSSFSTAIPWIGTVQAFLLIMGIIAYPIYDRGCIRTLIITGTTMAVFGLMMTSLASRYWEIFLAQGLCGGLGMGCLYVPSVAIVLTYFSTKRAMAVGLTSAGGILYPIIFRRLQTTLGFGWATRIIALIVLATQLVSLFLLRARTSPTEPRALFESGAFREVPFTLFTLGFFFFLSGLYAPYFYVPIYAERIIGTSPDFAFYLLAIINAGSFVGRVLPPLIAHRLGAYSTFLPSLFVTALIGFNWISVHSVEGIVVFSIFYGSFSGAVLALPPTVIVALSPNVRFAGTRIGMSFGAAGLGVLVGNPIYGAIVDIPSGKFVGAQGFAAGMMMAGSGLILASRFMRLRSHKDTML